MKKKRQTYKQNMQDIYNVMDLLKDELDRDEIEVKHMLQIDRCRRVMIDLYRSVSNIQTPKILNRLDTYRRTGTYPGFTDDLETLADRVQHFQYECDDAANHRDTGLMIYNQQNAEDLNDVLNAVKSGRYTEAYEAIEELPFAVADHIPHGLYEFLSRYE